MASKRDPSLKDADTASSRRRIRVILAMILVGILALAWFDGGEEPIRPISQEITLSGSN